MKDQGLRKRVDAARVLKSWKEAVGEATAAVSVPRKFQDGNLFVHIENGAWRTEIGYRQEEIKNKLNKLLGEVIVKKIILQ